MRQMEFKMERPGLLQEGDDELVIARSAENIVRP